MIYASPNWCCLQCSPFAGDVPMLGEKPVQKKHGEWEYPFSHTKTRYQLYVRCRYREFKRNYRSGGVPGCVCAGHDGDALYQMQ